MRKIFISILLMLSVICNPIFCFADSSSDFNIDENFTENVVVDNTTITLDFVPLLKVAGIKVPVDKKVSALGKSSCTLLSNAYEAVIASIDVDCGKGSDFSLKIKTKDTKGKSYAKDGKVTLTGIPEGEFTATIRNLGESDISCDTTLLGIGADATPEPGFDIGLSCAIDSASNIRFNVGAALIGLLVSCLAIFG